MKPWWGPRLSRVILRRQAHTQVAGSPMMVVVTDLEIGPAPWGLGDSPIWLCHEHYLPRDLGGAMPAHALGNRPTNLSPGCGPSGKVREQSCVLRDLLWETVHALGGRPTDLSLIVNPDTVL